MGQGLGVEPVADAMGRVTRHGQAYVSHCQGGRWEEARIERTRALEAFKSWLEAVMTAHRGQDGA